MDINGILGYNAVNGVYTSNSKASTAEKAKGASATDGFVSSPKVTDAGTYSADIAKTADETSGKATAEAMAEKLDKTESEKTHAYDNAKVADLISESEQKISQFRKMLDALISKQAEENGAKKVDGAAEGKLTVDENGNVVFSAENVEAAGLSTFDENGYWGAEQTAQRIFDMAIGFAGEDKELLETMKGAIAKGFGEVEGIFGGEGSLPDVCYRTKDRIAEMFDEYEKGLNGTVTE